VARSVRAFIGRLTAPWNQSPVVGEALAPLPLPDGCSSDSAGLQNICLSVIESATPLCRESRMKCRLLRPSRRAIPASAFVLKKYRCGIEPLSSTCHNEHTAASLGQAEILGIQDPPCGCSLGSIHTTSVRPSSP